MSMILRTAAASVILVTLLVPALGQEIPEICTLCYEGEIGGDFVHTFGDGWEGLHPLTPMTNGVHLNSAYVGGCAAAFHAHMCCEPT